MTGLASFFLDSSLINCRTMKFGVQIRLTSSNLGNGRVCDFMTELFYTRTTWLSIRYFDCRMNVFGGEMEDALLSVSEAARRLGGISRWTVHAWLSQGKLQRTKVGGRTMIRESELAKVIEDGGKSPSPRHKRG